VVTRDPEQLAASVDPDHRYVNGEQAKSRRGRKTRTEVKGTVRTVKRSLTDNYTLHSVSAASTADPPC